MADRAALAALGSLTALVAATLPERDAHPELYARSRDLVEALGSAPDWPARYARWELALLAELGFGLDLAACAVTGAHRGSRPGSRRGPAARSAAPPARPGPTGCCRSPRSCGAGWDAPPPAEVAAALALTGFFLEARVAPGLPREALPAARGRAVAAIGG